MGDYADSITKNDKRFDIEGLAPWVEKGNIIDSQRRRVVDLLKPLGDKVIVLLTGNHEETIHANHNNDITRNICNDLGVPYGGYHCFINLRFQRQEHDRRKWVVHAWHGAGAAQTEGARIMRLMRLVNEFEADIYLMGHLHAKGSYPPQRLGIRNHRLVDTDLKTVLTGSWLKTYDQPKPGETRSPTYGEMKGYKPSALGCPVIHICPDKNWVSIEL